MFLIFCEESLSCNCSDNCFKKNLTLKLNSEKRMRNSFQERLKINCFKFLPHPKIVSLSPTRERMPSIMCVQAVHRTIAICFQNPLLLEVESVAYTMFHCFLFFILFFFRYMLYKKSDMFLSLSSTPTQSIC